MTSTSSRADWLRKARWGVFCHYLADTPSETRPLELTVESWNARVDSFDVDVLAAQLESVGAPYFFLTIGQNSGFYCAPNAAYDAIVGRTPSRLSRRDLVVDLSAALRKKNIRLGVYLPGGAPENDALACEKLEWARNETLAPEQKRLCAFQGRWESIIHEWSLRWGDRVSAWWLDGCWYGDEMYRHEDEPNFSSFAAALKAGNPDALVAFNSSVKTPIVSTTPWEDFTAGEIDFALPVDGTAPWSESVLFSQVEGVQLHILSFLGRWWANGTPRFSPAFTREYTRLINEAGGVISWDVPISGDGVIPELFVRQLAALND